MIPPTTTDCNGKTGKPEKQPSNADVKTAALSALNAGLSTIPPRMDGTKAPIAEWKQYQQHTPSPGDIKRWYSNGLTGIGLICGAVSGNLECLDFDTHEVWEQFNEAATRSGLGELLDKVASGYSEVTPHGFHLLYRCSAIEGNRKLARRPDYPTPGLIKTLIETKAEGGFIIVAPSHGKVNADGDYVLRSGGFDRIAAITSEERQELLTLTQTFDEIPRQEHRQTHKQTDGSRPGDDYINSTSWEEVLEPEGWTRVSQHGETTYWRRPGKKIGISATTNHNNSDLLYVFTTSTVFDSERGYNRFSTYALTNHNSDFKAATRALAKKGYGMQSKKLRQEKTRDGVGRSAMNSKTEMPKEDNEDIVRRLAGLTLMEYERVRKKEAKAADGMRTSVLDRLVAAERKEIEKAKEIDDVIEQIESWERSVDGAELLHDAEALLMRHIILPPGGHIVIPLWAMGSYCMDAWQLFPKMLITSPRKRCGKTILLEALECIVFRALLTSNISPSAIFRCIEEWAPTLMMDEADTFTKDNDELNGIMNAGHRKRNATVIRSEKVGDTFMPRKFSVWCPQVIAGIGEQRGTMHDRSIHIEMRRKMPGESVMKLPVDAYEQQMNIRRRFMRWAEDNASKLMRYQVEPPACGNDRAQDNWLPLFTLAHAVGGDWPEKVKAAYLVFNATPDDESGDAGAMLLRDIQEILDDRTSENIFSDDLVNLLISIEDRPWFEWKRGKPLTQNSLSRLLTPYHIKSEVLRIGGMKQRGYRKEAFAETFMRYLSPEGVQSVATWQKDDKCHTATLQHPPEGHEDEVFSSPDGLIEYEKSIRDQENKESGNDVHNVHHVHQSGEGEGCEHCEGEIQKDSFAGARNTSDKPMSKEKF